MESANKKGHDFNFTHFMMVAKKFRMKMKQSGKKRRSKKLLEQEIYSNGEEEFFSEVSTAGGQDLSYNLTRWAYAKKTRNHASRYY